MNLLRSPSVLSILCAALLLAPTSGLAKKQKGPPDAVEDALAFATTDRARAVKVLEEAIADNPNGRDVDILMIHAGEQQRLSGDGTRANQWFSKVITRGQVGPNLEAAELGIALLDAGDGIDPQTLIVLQGAPEREVLATQNADRYLLLAVEAAKNSDDRAVSSYSKKALMYAKEDPEVLKRVQETLEAIARKPAGEVVVESPTGAGGSPLERAEAAYLEGDFEGAKKDALKAIGSVTGPELARAEGLVKVIDSGPADRNKIVVLLPLSGKYEAVGSQLKDAINFGYAGGGRTLEFVDSGGTAETSLAAFENAVLTKHAIAIVGPFVVDETQGLVDGAETLHVPLLSLSSTYEDTTGHHWALQSMYTRGDQIDAVLQWVMAPERGMKNFAIFAPDDPLGVNTVATFKKGVEARGGQITSEALYGAAEQNLLPFAQKFGDREGDLQRLRKEAAEHGGNPNTVVVPPRVDFDAIFIPDTVLRTPLATAALAFEEFPMGDFQPIKGAKKIPLLGLSMWNNTKLIAAGTESTRNSLFPDVFSSAAAGEADPFVLAYREKTGRTPSSTEAAMVDAGKLLAAASRSQADTRPEFRQALLDAKPTDSITGVVGFSPETLRLTRKMIILTITRSAIEKVGEVTVD